VERWRIAAAATALEATRSAACDVQSAPSAHPGHALAGNAVHGDRGTTRPIRSGWPSSGVMSVHRACCHPLTMTFLRATRDRRLRTRVSRRG